MGAKQWHTGEPATWWSTARFAAYWSVEGVGARCTRRDGPLPLPQTLINRYAGRSWLFPSMALKHVRTGGRRLGAPAMRFSSVVLPAPFLPAGHKGTQRREVGFRRRNSMCRCTHGILAYEKTIRLQDA